MKTLLLLLTTVTTFAAPEAFEVGPEDKDQLPRGKEADGIIGDFILRNDKIEAVIAGNLPLRRANMSTFYGADGITPGNLYDLTLRGANNDQLTCFQPAQQQGPVSWVRVKDDGCKSGRAVIEVMATAPNRDGIRKVHEYALEDGWQGVQVTTWITNEAKVPKKVLASDRFTTFWRTGTVSIGHGTMWAEAVDPADRTGYASCILGAPPDFERVKLRELKPGEMISLNRFVAVAKSPIEAVGLGAYHLAAVGDVSGTVNDSGGSPIAGATLVVRPAAPAPEVATNEPPPANPPRVTSATSIAARTSRATGIGYTDAHGRFSFMLPGGKYRVTFSDQGRGEIERDLEVKNGATVTLDATLPLAGAIAFDIRDEAGVSLPCKAQFLAKPGT
jgi:Carboxypeptidase regulatory-like domain